MWMTDTEIRTSYCEAANPKEQLEILAQLNACSINTIIKKLQAMGITPVEPKTRRTRKAYDQWTEDDVIQLLDLRHSGMSFNKIAKTMNRTETAIRSVLTRLDPNNKTEPTATMHRAWKKWCKKQLQANG